MIMLFGFITGSLARLAVPGPDPMPIWLTVAIGLLGSAVGGAIAIGIWGKQTQGIGIFAFIGAVLLVVAYRRFVQKRAIVGPEAPKQIVYRGAAVFLSVRAVLSGERVCRGLHRIFHGRVLTPSFRDAPRRSVRRG